MNARALLAGGLLTATLIALGVVLLGGDSDDRYRLRLQMPTAAGIRKNSDVRVGGVTVGKVKDLRVTPGDRVEADLDLDDEDVTVGAGASVNILAVNLLGEKYVALDPGDASRPMPSGSAIPSQRITPSVDLDQVLDVLDPDTRTRLRLLINETGIALTGRGTDLNKLLEQFPGGIGQASELLGQVISDNHSLGEVVDRAESFIARVNAQRRDLRRVITSADGAAETFADKSAELRQTLAQAPAALTTLRSFLADLRTTAEPLRPAARTLAATAPRLDATLAALPAFRRDAVPALDQAIRTAPALTKLGRQATPVVRRAVPTAQSLATFSQRVAPTTKTLGLSIDDLLGVLEGWGRAIQARDGLGHVFHGQVTLGADALKTILDSLRPAPRAKRKRPAAPRPVVPKVTDLLPKPRAPKVPTAPVTPKDVIERVGALPGKVAETDVSALLDYLLSP